MRKGEYEKALPYAKDAAQTWAAWAMICASQCHEALKHWEESEKWMRRNAERYEDSRLDWYVWCRRTGHGDEDAARALGQSWAEELMRRGGRRDCQLAGMFFILSDQPKEAKRAFHAALDTEKSPYDALHVAVLAYATEDVATRRAALRTAVDEGFTYKKNGKTFPEYAQLAAMLSRCLAGGPEGTMDFDAVDRLLDGCNRAIAGDAAYFLGRFLQLHGDDGRWRDYLRRSARSSNQWNSVLARIALRDHRVALGETASKPASK